MTRAVFFDRDGVINQKASEDQYITRWEDFHFLPGVIEGITQLKRAGFHVIVVTNQRCVAKGLLAEADLEELHRRMSAHLAQAGAKIDAVYYCPHALEPRCSCRKPAPGMLLEAARCYNLDLAESWMIGDSEIDIVAGKNAGCRTARLCHDEQELGDREQFSHAENQADIVAFSLLDLICRILEFGHPQERKRSA